MENFILSIAMIVMFITIASATAAASAMVFTTPLSVGVIIVISVIATIILES